MHDIRSALTLGAVTDDGNVIGERIREFRRAAGFKTQKAFAAAMDIEQSRVSDWERGRFKPGRDNLARIAKTVNKSIEAFIGPSEAEPDPDFDLRAGYKPDDLPLVAEGEASPRANIFWDSGGRLLRTVTERISRPSGVTDPRAYGVRVRGDSMLPVYRPGQQLVVSPSAHVADGDRVYVELSDDSHLVKIARKAHGGFMLESANPAYPPRFVRTSEIRTMHRVVWSKEPPLGIRTLDETTGRRLEGKSRK